MSAVDVRAVLEDCAAFLVEKTGKPAAAEDLRQVCTAVTQLIEADKEYDAALLALQDLNRKIAEQGWMDVEFDALRGAGMRLVKARQRRGDALARVGGGA